MGTLAGLYILVVIGLILLSIGLVFALPMVWYHIGSVGRKLDKIIKLLEKQSKEPEENQEVDDGE